MGAITKLNSDLGGFMPVIDETGKITGYKTTVGGADTVFPFSEIDKAMLIDALSNSGLGLTINSTPEQIYAALANKFPKTVNMLGKALVAYGGFVVNNINSYAFYGTNASDTYAQLYSDYYDISSFDTLELNGSINIGTTGASDPSFINLYMQPENSSSPTFTVATLSERGVTKNLGNQNISSLKGRYRLYVYAKTYNDGCYLLLNKCVLST